jgi:nucleotide-binding universal stress UspA family protein
MFKSALVCVKPAATSTHVLAYAIAVAQSQSWELECISVVDADFVTPTEPVPIGGNVFKKEKDEQRIAAVRTAADAAIAECQSACSSASVIHQAKVEEGDAIQIIARRAQEHDLLVVGHSGGDDTDEASRLVKLLKQCPRPALVVPQQPVATGGIVIAYDGSVQAARTLATLVYSGLAAQRKLCVTCFDANAERAKELAQVCQRFLAKHGLAATIHTEGHGGNIAKLLNQIARSEGAGMLAMGAFGKSSAREFFFGSVTRSMLRDLAIPVLLDQ